MTTPAEEQQEQQPASRETAPGHMPPSTPPGLPGTSPHPNPLPPERDSLDKLRPEVKQNPRLYFAIAAAALVTGFSFSALFTDSPGYALNITLGIAIFFVGWFLISRRASAPMWRKICAAVAMLYGAAMAVRASHILFNVNMLLAIGFTALACTPAYTPTMKKARATIVDLLQVFFNFVFGWIYTLAEFPWRMLGPTSRGSSVITRVLLGIVIAAPFLIVFGMLFASAEVRFSAIFDGFFTTLLTILTTHFWMTFWVAAFSLGLLRSAFLSASVAEDEYDPNKPGMGIGIIESTTVLALLNALFFIFVITQLPYLFGGQDRVSSTPGLPWSEYARRGFFELAWVTGLLIPTLMLFMHITRTETRRQKNLIFGMSLGLTVMGGIIVSSALQRMLLYTANFGLTELRIFVSTFIVMLALVLVLLNVLNFTGREKYFLPASLALGVLFSIGIQAVNVQGMIATDIANRYISGKGGDMHYLRNLSTDAIPALVESGLPAELKRDTVSSMLHTPHSFNWLYQPLSVLWANNAARPIL